MLILIPDDWSIQRRIIDAQHQPLPDLARRDHRGPSGRGHEDQHLHARAARHLHLRVLRGREDAEGAGSAGDSSRRARGAHASSSADPGRFLHGFIRDRRDG